MTELRWVRRTEELLSYIPFLFLILWNIQALVGMFTKGIYGSYILSFVPNIATGEWQLGRSMRGFSIIGTTASYVISFYLLSRLRPIIRCFCSWSFAMLGLVFYEFWWQLGIWVVNGRGESMYWGVVTILFFILIFYIRLYYDILDLTIKRITILSGLFVLFIALWDIVIKTGFYEQFFLFAVELAPDPTGIYILLDKWVGIVMWTVLIKK